MKQIFLSLVLISSLLLGNIDKKEDYQYETKVIAKHTIFKLKGKWKQDIIKFCEEDSEKVSEELNCKINSSLTRVKITLSERRK